MTSATMPGPRRRGPALPQRAAALWRRPGTGERHPGGKVVVFPAFFPGFSHGFGDWMGIFHGFLMGFSPATHGEKRDSSGDFHQQNMEKPLKRPGVSPTPRLLLLDAVGPWPH